MDGRRGGFEFRLLGPVEARLDGEPVALGGPRQRMLLALLLLEPGRPLAADRLAEELWHGAPPPAAATTLRSYLSRLRTALGREAVVADGAGYRLVVDAAAVDAPRFEELRARGREALARGAAGLAAERLAAALALWRGRALADVAEGGALAAEALRLDELRLACLEERIDADLALARHAELVPELRALVREEPLREGFWRQLVLALYRAGRQAEALAVYREARALLDEQLGLEPGEELRRLETAILRQEVEPVAPADTRHNLPATSTSFVGRERELDELTELLRSHRLVTLTGMGGAGKTRLATEVARRQVDVWRDGVWLADLTAVSEPGLVPAAVAATLGAEEPSLDGVLAHARTSELLLVLDNCEHVVAACADLADALLGACPNVRVLATSRIGLAVPAEVDYALDPLPGAAAIRLFVDRAAAVRRDLARDDATLATVETICVALDGLPLAIELAAARAKALTPAEIAERLGDRFRFLRAWQRVADPRHRTLGTTIDWSYDLLAEEERGLLRRLAVFAGGATLDAVADVCLVGDEERTLDLLGRLVDASIVVAEQSDRTRYRLLETVREYAAAKLAEDPDAEGARRRHAEYFLRLAADSNLSLDALGRGPQRQELVLREQHNLRTALDWAAAADVDLALRLMVELENFWIAYAVFEGRQRYAELLPRADGVDTILLARAWRDYAACADVLSDFETARRDYERSRGLFAEAGDEVGAATLDYRIGIVFNRMGDVERAQRLWAPALEALQRAGDAVGEMQVRTTIGVTALRNGDLERGRGLVEAGVAMCEQIGWYWWAAAHLTTLAEVTAIAGYPDEAEPYARRALELAVEMGNRQYVVYGLALFARIAAIRGDDERAAALWSAVAAVEDTPFRHGRFDREEYARAMPAGPLPEPLPLDDAVALALSR